MATSVTPPSGKPAAAASAPKREALVRILQGAGKQDPEDYLSGFLKHPSLYQGELQQLLAQGAVPDPLVFLREFVKEPGVSKPEGFLVEFYKLHRAHEVALNNATAAYEQSALRLSLVLNAGAMAAFLVFVQAAKGDAPIRFSFDCALRAIIAWGIGVGLAALATWFGYRSQRAYTQTARYRRQEIEKMDETRSEYYGLATRKPTWIWWVSLMVPPLVSLIMWSALASSWQPTWMNLLVLRWTLKGLLWWVSVGVLLIWAVWGVLQIPWVKNRELVKGFLQDLPFSDKADRKRFWGGFWQRLAVVFGVFSWFFALYGFYVAISSVMPNVPAPQVIVRDCSGI